MVAAFITKIPILLAALLLLSSCTHKPKYYKSTCDADKKFKHISFTSLIDSITYYDNQCVEVSGKYRQDKGLSALFNDSLFVSTTNKKGLWVEFSPECPLYLDGTRIGFFDYDYNGGKLTPVNDKTITLHGIVNAHYKGHAGGFNGSIGHISYIKL